MKRVDTELSEQFRKDGRQEDFLLRLNDILSRHQEEDYDDNLKEEFPSLCVIGSPRSGTTLIVQLIASHLDVGQINNLIAAFWRAPVYGIKLSRRLIGKSESVSYESTFGRTANIDDVHEFGYFWSLMLDYKDMSRKTEQEAQAIDWQRLAMVLKNMAHAYQKPLLFKPFLLGWHMERMLDVLPKTIFLRIRRDPIENALSILKTRQQYSGSVNNWINLKPYEYAWLKDMTPWQQVAGQIFFLERDVTEQVEKVGGRNVIDISYEGLCEGPKAVLDRVRAIVLENGTDVAYRSEPPDGFEVEYMDMPQEDIEKVSKAYDDFVSGRLSGK